MAEEEIDENIYLIRPPHSLMACFSTGYMKIYAMAATARLVDVPQNLNLILLIDLKNNIYFIILFTSAIGDELKTLLILNPQPYLLTYDNNKFFRIRSKVKRCFICSYYYGYLRLYFT